jgi:formylglycine-generating enzyme required for sulfatase activity
VSRKDDLEQSIEESNALIHAYQAVLLESTSFMTKARARREIEEQRARIKTLQAELEALAEEAKPDQVFEPRTPQTRADGQRGNHIFISYSHSPPDSTYAHKLAAELERRGFKTWLDDKISIGDRWTQVLRTQIDTCAALMLVMTPRSQSADWVQNELAYARYRHKPIFPLLLEGDHWLEIAAIQYVNVQDGRLPSQKLYDALNLALGRDAAPAKLPSPVAEQNKLPDILAPRESFEPEMVLIPAGEFLMGSKLANDRWSRSNERPQHMLALPDYYMARTPVTRSQYLAFVQATGHPLPTDMERSLEDRRNHPIVGIDWTDTRAYCCWLTEVTSRCYTLPSEAQWEKGARGTDGRIYPWGNKWDAGRCNSHEEGKGDTTPVGAYRDGASPYGLLDMVGNVWEWTRSQGGRGYPYDPKDGREDVGADGVWVLRGGVFHVDARIARCAYRFCHSRDHSLRYVGFRMCIETL